jgi:aldehyde:ferredoxin oxidoreductase
MATYGWVGKILRVDLTTGEITETPTSDYVPKLIGGRGVASMIYWEEVPPECAAFDPENALIMMTGVGSGTLAPASGKFAIVHKSPVPEEECFSFSVPGGHWAAELKFAGYDGIVVTGKSPRPVYLWINDGKAELRGAERLWGTTLSNMMLEIQNLHGPEARVLGIGPAGENLVRQAPIIVDREHATGISGAGAVMGSKNLKAIAVRGTGAVNVAKPQELIDLWYYYFRLVNRKPGEEEYPAVNKSLTYYMYHGPHIPFCEDHPKKPTDPAVYYQNDGLDDPISLMREAVDAGTVKLKWGGCWTCPVCCAMVYQSTDIDIPSGSGQCNDMESWPAWEWAGHKKNVGIPSIWFNRWNDDLGLGITNAAGYHFYWFFWLVKEGILTKENTGLPVDEPWSLEFIKGALENIAYRRGEMFDRIAEGEVRFLNSLAEEYPDVKAMVDKMFGRDKGYYVHWGPYGVPDTPYTFGGPTTGAIIAATAARSTPNKVSGGFGKSGMELSGLSSEERNELLKRGTKEFYGSETAQNISGEPPTWEGKVGGAILMQNFSVNMDCISMCGWANLPPFFSRYTEDRLGDPALGAKVYSAVTGEEMTHEEMLDAMNPIFNIERAIHVREGRRREHDWFSDVTFESAAWEWTSKEEFAKVLDEYYEARGWDLETGIPTRTALEAQGLKKIADELETKYGVSVPA